MSNTIGTSATSNVSVNYQGALTPDALLLQCATRLRSIDEQIQSQFTKQQEYRAVTSAVNGLQTRMTHFANNKGNIGLDSTKEHTGDPLTCGSLLADIDAAIAAAPPGSEAEATLKAIRADFVATAQGQDNKLDATECKSFADRLGTLSKEINSSAELDMINMTSLTSQRQTMIQMITNMVSAVNEGPKAIAANFRG